MVGDESYEVYPGATLIAPEPVLANDSDADGDSLTVAEWGKPEHGTFVGSADGSFQYTAPADGFTGPDTVEYTVEAAGLTATGTVTFTVNAAPMPQPDEYSIPAADSLLELDAASGVMANDDAPDGYGAILQAPASYGEVELRSDGSFTYTPGADFHGIDEFGYRIEGADGGRGGETTVLVRVPRAENTAPLAVADSYTTELGAALAVPAEGGVLANDSDPDGDVLRLVGFDSVSAEGGGVQIGPDGAVDYIPPMDFSGNDRFEYQVADGNVEVAGTVTVVVTAPQEDDPPADDDSSDDDGSGSDGAGDDGAGDGSDDESDQGGSGEGTDDGGSDGGTGGGGSTGYDDGDAGSSGGVDNGGSVADSDDRNGGSGTSDGGGSVSLTGSVTDSTDLGVPSSRGDTAADDPSPSSAPSSTSPTDEATTADGAGSPSSAADPTAASGDDQAVASEDTDGSFPGRTLAIGLAVGALVLALLFLLARRARGR